MGAMGDKSSSELIELIYAAIDDARCWQQLAQALALRHEAGQAGIVLSWRGVPAVTAWARPADGAAYLEHFQALDPFLAPGLVEQMSREPRAWLSQQLIEERELRGSDFYTEFLRPRGNLFWGCGGNYQLGTDLRLQIGVMRDKALGQFDETDRSQMDEIVRHAQRAASLTQRLGDLQLATRYQATLQDNLLDAVLALDGNDYIVQRNARASTLQEGHANDARFSIRSLRLAGASEQQRLQSALARARTRGNNETLRLLRSKPLPPLYVVIVPAPRAATGSLLLFLRDPRWPQQLPVNALCEMFQLTQAQARVCAALARGEAAEHIAADLGVAVNTIRSHIKLAMERLGVNRQSELVRHLGAALPALITAGPR
jgi:DNA-binding CsgD family transcriptional regulator